MHINTAGINLNALSFYHLSRRYFLLGRSSLGIITLVGRIRTDVLRTLTYHHFFFL